MTLSCEVTMLLCYDDVTPIEWVAQSLLARVGVLEFAPKRHFALRCESRWRGAKCVDWTARELTVSPRILLSPPYDYHLPHLTLQPARMHMLASTFQQIMRPVVETV